jgi:GTP cyclohydrolase I
MRSWQAKMMDAVTAMFEDPVIRTSIGEDHIINTPERFVDALQEYFSGVGVDPKKMLTKALFDPLNGNSQMIHVCDSKFYSMCAHHLAPIVGRWHFGYIPDKKIIGISKIPRLVEIFSRRPQVQENLTEQIVNAFQEVVQPQGCGLMMKASHFCMEARGAKAHGSVTITTALRGCFLESKTKDEFLLTASALKWSL